MEFFKDNLFLIGLALFSGIMLLLPSLKKGVGGIASLSVAEAVTLINRSHAVVVDVRSESEYATGHIVDAKSIPLEVLAEQLKFLKKYQDKPILLTCQTGMRSAKAGDILRKAEFTQVHNLQGGLNAWSAAKLPIVKS